MKRLSLTIVIAMIVSAALSRLVPHPYNFAPIAAMALFGGAHIANKSLAFLIPLVALFLSDLIIVAFYGMTGVEGGVLGLYPGVFIIYACFLAITAVGMLLKNRVRPLPVLLTTLGVSVMFFLVTNNVWLYGGHGMFPQTYNGMMECYIAALPFFRNTMLGDLFYSGVLFGGYALLARRLQLATNA